MNDELLLANVPEHITLGSAFLKATPVEEGGERILFMEASNEDTDHQNEVVLQKALEESAEYFLRHGNIDLSHYTLLGPKAGIPNHLEYEIGKPIDVSVQGSRTFVKAQLYRGDSAMARNANMVWDSLTKQAPPARWYPSVGGSVLAKSVQIDPVSKERVAVVEKVRWSNIALDRMPVNKTVPEISTLPVGTFAKSLGGFVLSKTLTAGYGTDSALLDGGGAMRVQSLHGSPIQYMDFRESVANALKSRDSRLTNNEHPLKSRLVDWAESIGVEGHQAVSWVHRFLFDAAKALKHRSKS